MSRTRLLVSLALFTLVGAGLALFYAWRDQGARLAVSLPEDQPFAEPGTVPIGGPFTLVDHTGRTVTQADFDGRYLLVFFGYTHCPDICPTTLADIANVLDLLGAEADAVQPLFVTLDPERDTPDRLAEYVTAFHPRIVGLTGTPRQIEAVAKEYRTFYEKVSAEDDGEGAAGAPAGDYLISHQASIYLMTPSSAYLTRFTYLTGAEEMAATIREAIETFGDPAKAGG